MCCCVLLCVVVCCCVLLSVSECCCVVDMVGMWSMAGDRKIGNDVGGFDCILSIIMKVSMEL